MSKTIRSPVFLLQLILVAAPITLLAALVGVVTLDQEKGYAHIALLIAGVGLIGFWTVSFRFLLEGAEGAMDAHPALWAAAIAGAALALSAPIAFLLFPSPSSGFQGFFGVAGCGVPLLIPLGHVVYAILGRKADKSFEPKALDGSP